MNLPSPEQLTSLRKAAEAVKDTTGVFVDTSLLNSDTISFITQANPATILALLDRVEELEWAHSLIPLLHQLKKALGDDK